MRSTKYNRWNCTLFWIEHLRKWRDKKKEIERSQPNRKQKPTTTNSQSCWALVDWFSTVDSNKKNMNACCGYEKERLRGIKFVPPKLWIQHTRTQCSSEKFACSYVEIHSEFIYSHRNFYVTNSLSIHCSLPNVLSILLIVEMLTRSERNINTNTYTQWKWMFDLCSDVCVCVRALCSYAIFLCMCMCVCRLLFGLVWFCIVFASDRCLKIGSNNTALGTAGKAFLCAAL